MGREAALFHHATGPPVALEVAAPEALAAKLPECATDCGGHRLGGKTVPPKAPSNPVPQLKFLAGPAIRGPASRLHEAHAADELARRPQTDRIGLRRSKHRPDRFETLLHAPVCRPPRRRSDCGVARQRIQRLGILLTSRAKSQALGHDHRCSLREALLKPLAMGRIKPASGQGLF